MPGPHHGHGHGHGHGDGHGHDAPHRFEGAEQWAEHLESPERAARQKPDGVVASLGLRPTDHVADLGSATGYFAVRLARAVPQGRVFAVDVEPDMVRYLTARAAKEGLANLQSVLGTADDPRLPSPVDLVFLCDAFHHFRDRQGYASRLRNQVRPGGRLAIVEYRLGELPDAPPEELRLSPEALTAELAAAGWKRVSLDETTLPFQYVAIFGGP